MACLSLDTTVTYNVWLWGGTNKPYKHTKVQQAILDAGYQMYIDAERKLIIVVYH